MENNLEQTLSSMILSASGWRGVFAENGGEESAAPEISGAHRIIAAAAANAFILYLKNLGRSGAVIVGRDSRPTGKAIADAVIEALLAGGGEVLYPGIAAIPEIMAYAKSFDGKKNGAAGFIYISASHNPIGHNGFKFGLTDGGVLPGEEAAILIQSFRDILKSGAYSDDAAGAAPAAGIRAALERVNSQSLSRKEDAKAAYLEFTREVITGRGEREEAEKIIDAIKRGIKERPLGIAADFNGSARTVSIDREFLSSLGAEFRAINDRSGEIRHAIVPEGESLNPCVDLLEELHKKDPSFVLGYVPDCDGDRGNLVIRGTGKNHARPLEAQEVFALACAAELAYLVWTGELKYDGSGNCLVKAALAVNDPTSMRIDRIAAAFGVEVFRAEVGEANVVGLARKLRKEGYMVRILGEGSAGGNITHPSAVRDPIDTLGAILKLLCIRSVPEKKGLFEIWCERSGHPENYREDFSLPDVISSLPAFITTGAYSSQAVMKVKTSDHALLKGRYQEIFLKEWEEKKDELKNKHGIVNWNAAVYNGTVERRGVKDFAEAGKGGLKIVFFNGEGKNISSIWMRGSGTEPVFRIMADVEGSDPGFEAGLVEWQRRMISLADSRG